MTESEAIQALQTHLISERGFLSKLQRGQGKDEADLATIMSALETLRVLWKDRINIPKVGAFPLVDVFMPVFESAHLYPEHEAEIIRLAFALDDQVDAVFRNGTSMTEEQAVGVLYGHLAGMPSIALIFHHREPLFNLEWANDLREALDTLAGAWANRELVSKTLVGLMLGIRGLIA